MAYQPGRGLNKEALERLRARKQAEAAVVPAEDKNEQWDRLLGEGAKKKLRCSTCTRPLGDEEIAKKSLLCADCGGAEARQAALKAMASEELGTSLRHFALRGPRLPYGVLYEPMGVVGGDTGACSSTAPASPTSAPASPPNKSASRSQSQNQDQDQVPSPKNSNNSAWSPSRPTPERSSATASASPSPSRRTQEVRQLQRGETLQGGATVKGGGIVFSVMSFNVLAECYVRVPDQPWNAFAYCEDEHLEWKNRLPKILKLIESSSPDILCLQEVVLEERPLPANPNELVWSKPTWLDLPGYMCEIHPNPNHKWENFAQRNARVVGKRVCTSTALLYKKSSFEQVVPSKGFLCGFVAYLRAKDVPDFEISVANAHLPGDPAKFDEHPSVLSAINKLLGRRTLKFICGDFNVECGPGNAAGDWLSEQSFQEAPTGTTWADPGNPLRLDHIFFQGPAKVQAVTGDLSVEEAANGMPCATCPSDHQPASAVLSCELRSACRW